MKVGHRLYTSNGMATRQGVVPYIRLSGRWLASLGFGVGEAIEVEARNGEVVLRVPPRHRLDGQKASPHEIGRPLAAAPGAWP